MKLSHLFYLIPIVSSLSCKSTATNDLHANAVSDEAGFFDSYGIFDMKVEAAFTKIRAASPAKTEYAAVMEYQSPAGHEVSVPITLTLRGHNSGFCDYPKMKFKIAKTDLAKAPEFAQANKIKVNSHCTNQEGMNEWGKVTGENGQFREAYIYRIANLLGMRSHRSRPIRLTYIDTESKAQETHNSFAYEDEDVLAGRMSAEEVKPLVDNGYEFSSDLLGQLDEDQAFAGELFRGLLADGDYHIERTKPVYEGTDFKGFVPTLDVHNFEVLKETKADGKVFLIPSDFDLSTAVRTRFVVSDPLAGSLVLPLTQENLNQRHTEVAARMKAMPDGEVRLERALDTYRGKLDLILKDLEAAPMDPEGKKSFRMHLESFYKVFGI